MLLLWIMSFLQYTACEVITACILYSGYDGDEVGIFRMYSLILTNSNHLCSNWFQLEDNVRGPFLSVRPPRLIPEAGLLCSSTSFIKRTRPFIIHRLISLRKCWGCGLAPLTHPYDHPFRAGAINPVFSHGSVPLKRIFNPLLIDWGKLNAHHFEGVLQLFKKWAVRRTWRLPLWDRSLSHYVQKGPWSSQISCILFLSLKVIASNLQCGTWT